MSSPPPNSETPNSETPNSETPTDETPTDETPTGGIRCPGCGEAELQGQNDRCQQCGWTLSEQTRRETGSAGSVLKTVLIVVGILVAVVLAAFIALFAVCATMMGIRI